ncbi:ASCH domain-containing protein [Streptomyces pactum]|uniref:RNA-binding protein n=1 Tax=Streptomyces pactum TaxID=68249 RepID=A0A1S6J8E5_9ACTN|nr:ASCH domain-containing protein [Streptomyces pactum]AQS68034.1 RNA-binding protein [Streptomyces pactum]
MTPEPASAPTDLAALPRAEFAFPGPLRDQLVAAILDGSKTSTTGLVVDYEHEGEPLPEAGSREVVVDSHDRPVAVIEVTDVRVVPLAEVDLAHAVDEGEGYTSVAEWRTGHERFWHSEEMRAALNDPGFTVDDATPAVLQRFRLVTVVHSADG